MRGCIHITVPVRCPCQCSLHPARPRPRSEFESGSGLCCVLCAACSVFCPFYSALSFAFSVSFESVFSSLARVGAGAVIQAWTLALATFAFDDFDLSLVPPTPDPDSRAPLFRPALLPAAATPRTTRRARPFSVMSSVDRRRAIARAGRTGRNSVLSTQDSGLTTQDSGRSQIGRAHV